MLRLLLTLALVLTLAAPALAAEYGEKLTDRETVAVSTLLENPDEYVGQTVRIEGRITGVCAHRGCWMDIAGDKDFESMRIKVQDGVMVFPAEAVGDMAIAEGVFTKIDLTPEQTAAMHKANCDAEGKGEGAGCDHAEAREPGVIYQIAGTGAVINAE